MPTNNICFADSLDVLKISSKEAVENIDSFSDFKEYMHVTRSVQNELISSIERASKSNKSELIMICGSVGDGKSHLLSYIKHNHRGLMDLFYLHNDASESLNPIKTSMDTLSEVLEPFSDEGLLKGGIAKVIVAINLGTLNNFIESKYKDQFKQLRKFVIDHKIIESDIIYYEYDEDSSYHYVNFSDYHMYELTEKGPKSKYIEELLVKIVGNDEDNYFNNKYRSICGNCDFKTGCPINANYEFLKIRSVRKGVINVLVKAMIKGKLIISTRDLLNLFNNILTGGYSGKQIRAINGGTVNTEQILLKLETLLINNMFQSEQKSHVLDELTKVDPVHETHIDDEDKIIKYELSNNVIKDLQDDIDELNWNYIEYMSMRFKELLIKEEKVPMNKISSIKKLSFKTYKRFQQFNGKEESDYIYNRYMLDLYYSNIRAKRELKDIVKEVKEVLYKWDGSAISQAARVISSKKHKSLGIYEKISIKPQLRDFVSLDKQELDRFITTIFLKFTRENRENEVVLNIDYPLYRLIKNLSNGYIPTEEDYSENINLQLFIEKLLNQGEEGEKELIFEDTTGTELCRYNLIYNSDFDEYEFKRL